jgi:glycerol-3-phosphate dehydrogenase
MGLRDDNLEKLPSGAYDVLVVGGGINGAVSVAALAGRGAKVALIDRGDFAGFTSQESSNLVWGGIKYLESYELGLVRKLCRSRNELIRSYPSTVREIRFFTTLPPGFRHPLSALWLGAWAYWAIGNSSTRPPRLLSRERMRREEPVIDPAASVGGFEYSDAYLPDGDARFVFGFVRAALDAGCVAANYVESLGASRQSDGLWATRARDHLSGSEFALRSRVLLNAAGPFVDQHNCLTGQRTRHRHVFSKGIHLIVPKLTERRRVLSFFASDGRPFFAIPMANRTCIGTTDTRVDTPYTQVTEEDRDFVLHHINAHLALDRPLSRSDILAKRCGVRPLAVTGEADPDQEWSQLSRKHVVETNPQGAHISIFGGKLSDCLNVGEEVCASVARIGIRLPNAGNRWYGEPPEEVRNEFLCRTHRIHLDSRTAPDSSEKLTTRFWGRYGAHAMELLEDIREDPRQAEVLIEGTGYTRCELRYAARSEMVSKLEDFLRRRSEIALTERRETLRRLPGLMEACRILFGERAQERFDEYFEAQRGWPSTGSAAW